MSPNIVYYREVQIMTKALFKLNLEHTPKLKSYYDSHKYATTKNVLYPL